MNIRRLLALFVTLILAACAMPSQAESLDNVVVVSAPLRRSDDVQDGMVRVWIQSIGDPTHLDVTVTGSYSVNGNTALTLETGDTVAIDFDKSTGAITMLLNGVNYAMGSEMRLRRHQASGESALSIAQADRPANLYPGDLQLLAVKKTDGYRLYPIVHVYLEYYLQGVVPYEMSSSFPIEALKAQAVAARTYTMRALNARAAYDYDLGDTSSDQVYKGYTGASNNATRAVDETKGIVVMNAGVLTGTYYTASNGGQTESVKNAWGSSGYGYLTVKDDPFDAMNTSSNRRRLSVYSDFDHASQNAALSGILATAAQNKLGAGAVIQTITSITPHTPKYPVPSRLYTLMDFGVTALVNGEAVNAPLTLSIFDDLESPLGLSIGSSQNELWSVQKIDGNFRITVSRWGHGIGLSQRGAQQMASMGYTYDQILGFYYEGCERVQYTFTHTILPAGGTGDVLTTEPPAAITPAEQDQATVNLSGSGDVAVLRYAASDGGKILTGIPNGAAVTVLAKGAAWSLVQYGEINGYLPTEDLTFIGTPPTSTDKTPTNISLWGVITGTNALNFRTGPGYDYSVQSELAEGTVLCVLSTSGEWARVQHGSVAGYVSPDYLTMHSAYPGSAGSSATAVVTLTNTEETAPLLGSPSTGATALYQLPHGAQVQVLSNDGSWCRVRVAGLEGYLLTSQLEFGKSGTVLPDASVMTATVNSNASTLNLRAGPSTDDAITAQIPKGTVIVVTSYGDTWCAVTWGELSGYVMTQYLLFPEDENPDAPNPDAPAAPEEIPAWVVNTVVYAHLRQQPGAESSVITQIPGGDELFVLEKGETYSYVRHGVGEGYILNGHLTYVKPLESIGILYVNTASDALALRDHADLYDSTALAYIPKGEAVMLLEELGDWCHVQYGEYVGYCAAEYLSRRRPTEYEADTTPIYDPTLTLVSGWSGVVNLADGETASLREWCSGEAPELASIPDGSAVKLLARGEIWCKITYEGETGYCLTDKLILLAPTAE